VVVSTRLKALLGAGFVLLSACSANSSHTSTAATSATSLATSPATAARASVSTPATSSAPAEAASGSCYTGSWVSTDYAQQSQGETTHGGSGFHLSISSGEMTVDFTGMQPVTLSGSVEGQGIFSGSEQAPVTFSPSGTFTIVAKGTSNVTFESKFNGAASFGDPIPANSFPSSGIHGSYRCSGSTLSLTVPTPQGPTTWTLARS